MSADTGLAAQLRGRWDIGLVVLVVALTLALLAAIADRGVDRPVGFAASPLPTVSVWTSP